MHGSPESPLLKGEEGDAQRSLPGGCLDAVPKANGQPLWRWRPWSLASPGSGLFSCAATWSEGFSEIVLVVLLVLVLELKIEYDDESEDERDCRPHGPFLSSGQARLS